MDSVQTLQSMDSVRHLRTRSNCNHPQHQSAHAAGLQKCPTLPMKTSQTRAPELAVWTWSALLAMQRAQLVAFEKTLPPTLFHVGSQVRTGRLSRETATS